MAEKISLTGPQTEAVNHSAGRLRVIACPGSGKTEVIAHRIAKLIETGERPAGIAVITFTEKAAGELKMRIRRILEKEYPERADFGDMFIGTIHAFCLEMLRGINPVYGTYDVLDGPRRVAYLSKSENYYRKIGLVKLQNTFWISYYKTIAEFIRSTDVMITERIDPKKLTDQSFAKCFVNYLSALEDDRYFDFPTIILRLVDILESNPDSRSIIASRTEHVIVDEFQDVDRLQERLLDLLSLNARSVAVVGDDDQGIYQWRGTDVGIIRGFADKDLGECRDVKLETNFRSTARLVELSSKFISHNSRRISKKMESNPELRRTYEKGDIQAQIFDTREKELDYIVEKIKELHGTDFTDRSNRGYSLSYSNFAVLTRTNDLASKVIDRLDGDNIPSVASSGESIFNRPEVKFAVKSLAYVFDTAPILDKSETPELKSLVHEYSSIFSGGKFPEADAGRFMERIESVRKKVSRIFKKKTNDYLSGLGLQEIYHEVLAAFGADIFDFGDVYSYNLAALSQAVSDYESVWVRLRASEVKYFFYFLKAYGDSSYQDPRHSDELLIDAVRIMTIHKAKGLEFPVVFVPDFVERSPRKNGARFIDRDLYDTERYSGDDEDERRVYYTALTRSEKYLFLTGSARAEGKTRRRNMHRFLQEMPQEYLTGMMTLKKPRSGLPPRAQVASEFETSYSELTSYMRCPEDFLLRNVYGFNAGVPPAFGYGTNVHNILNMIHREFIRKGTIPNEKEIGETVSRMFRLRYATGEIEKNMKVAAEKIIKRYVRIHSSDFSRILETEKRFEFVLGNALIGGQIDLLKKLDSQGDITRVEIIDFKAEREEGIYSSDYDRQLRYYAIACLESLKMKPQKAVVHILDAGADGKESREVDISDTSLISTRHEIEETVSRIRTREFSASPDHKKCKKCDYIKICSFRAR